MCSAAHAANLFQDALTDQFVQITCGRPGGAAGQAAILRAGNREGFLDMLNRSILALVDAKTGQHTLRQPIPPQRCDEVRAALPEVGLGQASLKAIGDHVGRAGSGLLNILHTKERFGN